MAQLSNCLAPKWENESGNTPPRQLGEAGENKEPWDSAAVLLLPCFYAGQEFMLPVQLPVWRGEGSMRRWYGKETNLLSSSSRQ